MKKRTNDTRIFVRAAIFLSLGIIIGAWIIANMVLRGSIRPRGLNIYPPSEGLGQVLYVQPVNCTDRETMTVLAGILKQTYKREVKVLDPITLQYGDGGRENQLKADFLRSYITKSIGIPRDTYRLLAVTEEDLYTDGYNFVFGQAELGGMVAVISTARLKPMMDGGVTLGESETDCMSLYYERLRKLIRHELGHTLGLTHCDNPQCVMSFHASLDELDEGGEFYCEKCLSELARDTIGNFNPE
jgi:archaemetzincin